MNLSKVESVQADVQYIKDHGVNQYLRMIAGEKIADTKNPWKDYDAGEEKSLFSFCDENDIAFKTICKFIDKNFADKAKVWVNDFCNYTDNNPESLDDTIVETVEHGNYTWEEAVDILDKIASDDEKVAIIKEFLK